MASSPLLVAEGLTKHFVSRRMLNRRPITVRAVDDVSLQIEMGETLALVGEIGCNASVVPGRSYCSPNSLSRMSIVSALDISVRAQILQLLKHLQQQIGLSYIFITHNLAVVRSIASREVVMYLGKIDETSPVDEMFSEPLHPYNQALLSATPIPNPRRTRVRERIVLYGEIPSPANPPSCCRFPTRCPFVRDICRSEEPKLRSKGTERLVACHLIGWWLLSSR